ncbi:type I Wadjet antiplasmid transformation system protein JetB [Bacillus cereus]|uniref:type I Wadjet antiplasmid transformation system protein JetB n=1 Tax=Bacillus cereus TaxID=1396 RepID=UPI000937E7A5|nr:type I Wadjet antiplasmid transformation system protein JetB [Bacillus cereus]OKA27494.1 hypothetical protein BJR05_16340 [Bacillus cereus]
MQNVSEREREEMGIVVNYLFSHNFLLKEFEREKYHLAVRNKDIIKQYLQVIGWDFIMDEKHGCIVIVSPHYEHRLKLKKDETIWLLVLRLIYEEKRSSLSISQYPFTTLQEIKGKYETFRLTFVSKTKLRELVQMGKQNQLLRPIDNDIELDDCRFQLFHSCIHVLQQGDLNVLYEKIKSYSEGGDQIEMDDETTIN